MIGLRQTCNWDRDGSLIFADDGPLTDDEAMKSQSRLLHLHKRVAPELAEAMYNDMSCFDNGLIPFTVNITYVSPLGRSDYDRLQEKRVDIRARPSPRGLDVPRRRY